MSFQCDRCGQCCRHVGEHDMYKHLADENGVCRYLKGNLCSIYNSRPLICNVDAMYERHYKNIYTREEFYELNNKSCKVLKAKKI